MVTVSYIILAVTQWGSYISVTAGLYTSLGDGSFCVYWLNVGLWCLFPEVSIQAICEAGSTLMVGERMCTWHLPPVLRCTFAHAVPTAEMSWQVFTQRDTFCSTTLLGGGIRMSAWRQHSLPHMSCLYFCKNLGRICVSRCADDMKWDKSPRPFHEIGEAPFIESYCQAARGNTSPFLWGQCYEAKSKRRCIIVAHWAFCNK